MSTITTSPYLAQAIEVSSAIDNIIDTHHRELRRLLPRFDLLMAKIAAQYGLAHCRLRSIVELFVELEIAFGEHLNRQEQLLFPRIKRLRRQGGRLDDDERFVELMGELRGTNERIEELFDQISVVTDGYNSPSDACGAYAHVVRALGSLEEQTHDHFTIEELLTARSLAD